MNKPHFNTNRSEWLWDVFCAVVDNHGDLGVCWRLANQLSESGHRVRLWVDNAQALQWMAPHALQDPQAPIQVLPWPEDQVVSHPHQHTVGIATLEPAQVWLEAFGCHIPEGWVSAQLAARHMLALKPPVWLNLEYLSAETWVTRMHRLPSPVLQGPASGCTKWFYYPGFTPDTGGLLREADLLKRRAAWKVEGATTHISLFCYEPPALAELLALLDSNTHLWVCAGRPTQAVQAVLADHPHLASTLQWTALPYMPQPQFDELLWSCQLNLVRGEDSLVRALWAGQPLVWHIYPQDDFAHVAKLDAFLDWLQAPTSLRAFHHRYNGLPTELAQTPLAWPDHDTMTEWRDCIQAARERLLAQPSLVEQLVSFVAKKL